MLNDSSSVRITQSVLTNTPVEGNENVIESELHEIHVPSLRTPLDSIPDPSQYQRGPREIGDKPPDGSQGRRLSVRKIGVSDSQLAPNKALGSINGLSFGTPRVYARGKTHSEPNSAQSTPARNSLKVSITGSLSGVRPPHSGARGGSNYRVPRGIPFINSEQSIEVPYFELEEDLSFWKDHNVQVLLRIRPLSNAEMVSQGYGRCLRQESAQTLVWLGHPESRFTFDHIACEMISQEKLFKVVGLPMVDNCMSGYNSCIFAYGQTGSGKTYTMMGEICQMDGKLDEDCGITPRIFKYLFTNIREEEENRQDERLNYVCKCSFLEIYNEQITDLLEPSSTNLQVREDLKKGVYVENLTEHTVRTVNDVLKLLLQGAANRKMAATYMNSESSRSHSVFTCTVESRWEKDSMTHLRFGRLNLVDLAGSERQKSSGAEGDRLKEAANINKSLSTLGLVIMSLVDLAHGKHRHVPYRDSRLTFLLQDSLGGNSKTTIIANISPSTCATNETLSTLKFAQRAKLIQNNAIVNEDASGNVTALQHQIQQLQGQLSFLMKHHNISRSFSSSVPSFKQPSLGDSSEEYDSSDDGHLCDGNTLRVQERKIKGLEATLASALRREKLAQIAVRRLEAENEGMNRLAQQREDDAWVAKMMLRICEEKIRSLELFADGSVSADKYVMEENSSLKEENQLHRKRIDRNPELTRIAIDNTQLLDQLRLFQELCEQGERENMLAEISELRNQLMESLERNYDIRKFPFSVEKQLQKSQDNNLFKELEDCKNMNSNLIMNVDELRAELRKFSDQAVTDSTVKDPEDFKQVDAYSSDETISTRCIGISKGISLDRMAKELEKAQLLNCQYQEDHALQRSQNQQIQLVCEQVEMETTKTILHLQEEVAALQSELKQKLSCMVEENVRLRDTVAAKEDEIRTLSKEWESATLELTSFLVEGSKYLRDASGQVEKIVCSFPYSDLWLGEHVEKAAKVCIEKEETILLLQKSLEDAQEMVLDMEQKLNSLKGAAHVLAGVQQQENQATSKETTKLTMLDMSGDLPMPYDAPIIELERSSNDVFEEVFVRNNITENVTLPKMVISFERGGQHIPEMALALEDIKGQVELAKQGLLETEDAIYLCSIDANEYMSALQRNIHEASFLYRELVQGFEKNINETREKIVELKHICRSCHFLMVKASSQEAHNIPEHEIEHFLLHQVRNEVLRTSDRLRTITVSIEIALNMYDYTSKVKGLVEKGDFDAACSTSRSDTSIDHVAPENDSDESRSGGSNSFDGEITVQFFNLEPEEGSNFSTDDQESEKLKGLAKIYIDDKTTILHLRRELKRANDAFDKLDVQLAAFLHKKSTVDCSYQGIYFREPLEILYVDEQDIHRNAHYQHTMSKLSPVLQLTELKEQVGEADYQSMKEFWGSQSINNEELSLANSLFTKLEEALATTKEADMMLNALLKANENAQRMTCMWKQECEKLIMEKASAINEVEQLNSSIRFKAAENEILQDQIKCSLKEVANLMSLFEGSFLNMQRDVDEMFKVMFADAITMAQDLLNCFCNSKLSFEAIYSTIVEQGFASVLYQCKLGEILRKFISPTDTSGFHEDRPQKSISVTNSLTEIDNVVGYWKGVERGNQSEVFKRVDGTESGTANNSLINENSLLKKELERKEDILKGLLFDFSLLQESASTKKDMKDEVEKLILAFSQLQQELQIKTDELNDLLVQHSQLQARFVDTENALVVSNSDLEQAKGTVDGLSDQIDELSVLLKDMYLRKSEVEEKLEEQSEVVKTLEKEILRISSSAEEKLLSSIEDIEVNFRSVPTERDQLLEQVRSLQDKLDMAYSLVDENEAIAFEARQESEASKVYAEQKEEEVRILEHSVQELECTVNVLEKKVYEMEEELEKHKLIRDSLSLELQSLKQRMLTVESFSEDTYSENSNTEQPSEDQLSRQLHKGFLELHKAQNWIRLLEEERAEQAKEIKQCKEYISELVLHAEAQALQYQQKYKTLEEMVREVNRDSSTITSASLTEDKPEKSLMKPRGSSSPFRCIAGLVQQMNLEKDQELSAARLHIEELEALAANRQKQVCMLNTRLAAAESMTHDVIRDLLGVKLDITNYANMIDQYQLQKLVENAQLQTKESTAMEKEILNLSRQINDLVEERERFIAELNRRQADVLAAQVTVEQLQERGQFLTTQNEMMKADNSNLKRRIVELDEIVKKLFATQSTPVQIQQQMKQRGDNDLARRLEKSEKLLLRVNDELAQYRKSNCGNAPVKVDVHVLERRARNLE